MFRKFFIVYLIMVVFFLWGYIAMQYGVFPGEKLIALKRSIASLLVESPNTAVVTADQSPQSTTVTNGQNLATFTKSASRDYEVVESPIFKGRNFGPLQYKNIEMVPGYRVLYGAFDIATPLHSVILINSTGQIVHQWVLDDSIIRELRSTKTLENEVNTRAHSQVQPNGLGVLRDGSVVISDDNRGIGIFKLDACSEVQWSTGGQFNDTIEVVESGEYFWSIQNDSLVQLRINDGKIALEISINDLHLANPNIAVFTPRRNLRVSKWYHNPINLNDVEPLPDRLAQKFDQFDLGDLLVSYRSLNLIAVIDPDSLKIKWWRTGISLRQYDVDWGENGVITVYDNNRRESADNRNGSDSFTKTRFSRILSIDPKTMKTQVLYDGESENFYNSFHGKHQILPNGSLHLSSPQQGRFLEISKQGDVVFEWINQSDENRVFRVSEIKWLPEDYFSINMENLNCN